MNELKEETKIDLDNVTTEQAANAVSQIIHDLVEIVKQPILLKNSDIMLFSVFDVFYKYYGLPMDIVEVRKYLVLTCEILDLFLSEMKDGVADEE